MQLPQSVVGIPGKKFTCRVKDAGDDPIGVRTLPDGVELAETGRDGNDQVLTFYVGQDYPLSASRTMIGLEVAGKSWEVPLLVLSDREFFVVFVLQGNVHDGWNPRMMAPFYDELRGGKAAHTFRKETGVQGPEARGHAFQHHLGDAEELAKYPPEFAYKPLEQVFHEKNIPISWLIDPTVAQEFAGKFHEWRTQFQDSVGYLPPSYFYQNNVNFNVERAQEETTELLKQTKAGVDAIFSTDYPLYSRYCGIDQWVGSIGTHWIRAAQEIGLEGIWGMGWDHRSCDTSMYHRGAPWNAYKPDPEQFRCVKQPGHASRLWAFQWTVRDLVNTLPISPHGSVCFSTDADDVRSQGILYLEREPTYFWSMLWEYYQNFKAGNIDHFVFLVHQEDHDAHFKDNNEFLDLFAQEVSEAERRKDITITVATLEEVTAWLNVKYAPEENNTQFLELDDPLSLETRKAIQEKYFDAIARIYDPDEEEEIWTLLNENWPADRKLPKTVAYFGENCLFLAQYPKHMPLQYFNYGDPRQCEVEETGELVMSALPEINAVREKFSAEGYSLEFEADREFSSLPWVVWKDGIIPGLLEKVPRANVWLEGRASLVYKVDVKEGKNSFLL